MNDVRLFWVNSSRVLFTAESKAAKRCFKEIFGDVYHFVDSDLRKELKEQLEKEYGLIVEGG